MKPFYLTSLFIAATAVFASAERVAYFPMDLNSTNKFAETVSGNSFDVKGQFDAENKAGVKGQALRFDGYSSHATGQLPAMTINGGVTISMWVAPETYPVIALDAPSDDKACVAGNLNATTKQGWEIRLGKTGKYAVNIYSAGRLVTLESNDIMARGEWNHVAVVIDINTRKLTLYRNGVETGSNAIAPLFAADASTLSFGKDDTDSFCGPFLINTFNGLIDEVEVYNEPLAVSKVYTGAYTVRPDFTTDKFYNQSYHPKFHGMPSQAWTNESHGMTYSDGRFHVFFQKNANGPYMTRLHWGHISSPDLCNWTEEPIAIAPDCDYDIKGCWSGCVFTDNVINAGRPTILYTGVDYGRARIIEATPKAGDKALISWDKKSEPAIDGRPSGLSDDFRDPYFFRNGADAYIIVGSSKDGKGVCTLHKYNNGKWTNDGSTFFQALNPTTMGTFWEMPNVTKIGDKWLFTTTPLGMSDGVKCIYWTGDIASNGTFSPASQQPRQVELISKDGFGMLSPTIYQHEGKTIALGIVPDKLPGDVNYQLGWAHTYSLPREWSLNSDGELVQKPYEGLTAMRAATGYDESDININGVTPISVAGNRVELLAEFEIGNAPFGFNFLKSANGKAVATYSPATRELKIDFTALPRIKNDEWCYNGVYACTIPAKAVADGKLKLNMFIDGSILDIFVNDTYATSIRVFPTDADAKGIELFSTGGTTKATRVRAWNLINSSDPNGVEEVATETVPLSSRVDVYTIAGSLVKSKVAIEEATFNLPKGIYIIAGRKVIVK